MTYPRAFSAAILFGLLCVAMPLVISQAATYTAQEQANIKLVADFYAALDAAGSDLKSKIRGIAEQYLKPDYIQHMQAQGPYGKGRDGFIRMLEQMPPMPAAPGAAAPQPPKVLLLNAEGDLVVRISSRTMPGREGISYIFNMFRVQDGKLAEHWDATSGPEDKPAPPPGSSIPPSRTDPAARR